MNCGLLGRHLSHSYSPSIKKNLGTYDYQLFQIEPENLSDFLTKQEFDGLNVNIPYKKTVIPFCDQLSPQAQEIGAVNTIIQSSDGRLIGHNTDYFGFASLLTRSGLTVSGRKCLVLGSGGASATVQAVLRSQNAEVIVVSRSGENNYENIHLHQDAHVIINATPVGMYPDNGISPIDISLFPYLSGVIDLIYNPSRTQLLLDAESRGIVAINGLWMLVAQAKESAEWFTGEKILDSKIEQIYEALQKQMENLILIGMPGCGKSTIGALIAQHTKREYIDVDAEIIKTAGITIPEIFAQYGEDAFRKIETDVLRKLCKGSGLVIATGGGCVTRKENYPLLHQNGRIVWVQRELSALPTDGRPLSQSGKLAEMYAVRAPLYDAFADLIVLNNATPEAIADEIMGGI